MSRLSQTAPPARSAPQPASGPTVPPLIPFDNRFYRGKPRSCTRCQSWRRKCSYPEGTLVCSPCSTARANCSGPVVPSTKEERTINVAPSSTSGKLLHSTLYLALGVHLIGSYGEIIEPSLEPNFRSTALTAHAIPPLLSGSRNTKQEFQDVRECIATFWMYIGLHLTTHSSIIGHALTQKCPPSSTVAILHSGLDNEDLYQAIGQARHLAAAPLRKRLVVQLEQVIRHAVIPGGKEFWEMLHAIGWLSEDLNEYGEKSLVRLLLERGIYNMCEGRILQDEILKNNYWFGHLLYVSSVGRSKVESPFIPRTIDSLVRSQSLQLILPPLYSFTNEELDFLVDFDRAKTYAPQIGAGIIERFVAAGPKFTEALHWAMMHRLQNEGRLEEACDFCWDAMGSLGERNRRELSRLFDHPLYGQSSTRGVTIMITTFLQDEQNLSELLSGCHQRVLASKSERLLHQSTANIRAYLSRIASLWALLKTDPYQKFIYGRVLLLKVLPSTLNAFKGELLNIWTLSSPEQARSILKPLSLASAFSIKAPPLIKEIGAALVTAERVQENVATKMVGIALMEMLNSSQ